MTIESKAVPSPWHLGEKLMQEQAGVAGMMESHGHKVLRDYLTDQHRAFYPLLPFIVIGTVDDDGIPWASLIEGEPGFLHAPDEKRLTVAGLLDPGDPANVGLGAGKPVGLLGIELPTRRRNRLNGSVENLSGSGFTVKVEQSFGNCPQYIQKREYDPPTDTGRASSAPPEILDHLDEAASNLVASADTFFVASFTDIQKDSFHRSVDVSHRGGRPGFIKVENGTLTIPDWSGNSYFNTLGNLLVNPKAGLLFLDFENDDLLQIWGDTTIVFAGDEVDSIEGAERIWRVAVRKVVRRPHGLSTHLRLSEFSPNSLAMGVWPSRQADTKPKWFSYRVARIADESSTVRSFYLASAGHQAIRDFEPGQYIPIRLQLPSADRPAIRTYSLSAAPSDDFLRISVKRDGAVSCFLHDHLNVDDIVDIGLPGGHFTIDTAEQRPAVLVSAGIGITPLLSMLRELISMKIRTGSMRKTFFLHGATNAAEQAFVDEVRTLQVLGGPSLAVTRVLSRPEPELVEGRDFDFKGRIDIDLLKRVLPFDDYDFFICGPASFTQSLYDRLRQLGVHDLRIHSESFGPSSLVRTPDPTTVVAPVSAQPVAADPVKVVFQRSQKDAEWRPSMGTLLDLAEASGLAPEFGCRTGTCGSCRTTVVAGDVAYKELPTFTPGRGEALMCCAYPADSSDASLILDL